MQNLARAFLLLLVSTLSPSALASAQLELGSPVVLQGPDVLLKIGKRIVATGETHRVYTVKRQNGAWLWLEAQELAGWVKADQVIPFDQALREANDRVDRGERLVVSLNQRGLLWMERGRTDLALADYDQALRIDPDYGAAYLNRALAKRALGQLDAALADLDESAKHARLDPLVYYNRALVRLDRGEYQRALGDLDLALSRNPSHASSWFNRAAASLLAEKPTEAAADARMYLQIAGWKEPLSAYAALLGWTGATRAHLDDLASGFLDDAGKLCDPKAWPYPIIQALSTQPDLDSLLPNAPSEREKSEARLYIAIAWESRGLTSKAREQFEWLAREAEPNRLPGRLATLALHRQTPLQTPN